MLWKTIPRLTNRSLLPHNDNPDQNGGASPVSYSSHLKSSIASHLSYTNYKNGNSPNVTWIGQASILWMLFETLMWQIAEQMQDIHTTGRIKLSAAPDRHCFALLLQIITAILEEAPKLKRIIQFQSLISPNRRCQNMTAKENLAMILKNGYPFNSPIPPRLVFKSKVWRNAVKYGQDPDGTGNDYPTSSILSKLTRLKQCD